MKAAPLLFFLVFDVWCGYVWSSSVDVIDTRITASVLEGLPSNGSSWRPKNLEGHLRKRHAPAERIGRLSRPCEAPRPLPMWSWGFAWTCCDVFPDQLGVRERFFEHGDLQSKHYFKNNPISNGSAVYVTTPDFAAFLDVFLMLPSDMRLVLVTGSEDIGVPYELFHPNRPNFFDYKMSSLWPRGQKISMEEFILDPRLVRWFVQNYDLVRCNIYTCSDVSPVSAAGMAMIAKMQPIPIGLDFHSALEASQRHIHSPHIPAKICEQRMDLDAIRIASQPFASRQLGVVVAFDCKFDASKIGRGRLKSRGEVCSLLDNPAKGAAIEIVRAANDRAYTGTTNVTSRRLEFWKMQARYAFALAPAGFGMDTHRLWEILAIGSVPITLTSPLDRLYSEYPVIILEKWGDLFVRGALDEFRQRIFNRFGAEPFSDNIQNRLSLEYWVKEVRDEQRKIPKKNEK